MPSSLIDTLPRLTHWLHRHKGATGDDVAAFYATCDRAELVQLDRRMRSVRADLRAFLRAQNAAAGARFAHGVAEGIRRRLTVARDAPADQLHPVDLDALDEDALDDVVRRHPAARRAGPDAATAP